MNKPTTNISHAHDRFFRQAMSDKHVAKEFFEAKLPADLIDKINLDNLEMQPGSYIDDMRQESIADILYKTKIGGQEGYLYLIVDHQSTPDKLMPFRVLRYTCNIITKYLNDHKNAKYIPMILPLVVYHGEKKWSYSNDINDLVDAPKEIIDAYFLKPFLLIDLAEIDDELLKQKVWFGAMALTLKHIFDKDMTSYVFDIIKLFKLIDQEGGQSFIEVTIRYILDRGELPDKKHFFEIIQAELSPETGEKIMTIAEQLRQEGIQKGIQKGQELVAIQMLSKGMKLEQIAELTQLSIDRLKTIRDQNH